MAKRKRAKARNAIMACVQRNDPERFRTRTVQSEREKKRPRKSNQEKLDEILTEQ